MREFNRSQGIRESRPIRAACCHPRRAPRALRTCRSWCRRRGSTDNPRDEEFRGVPLPVVDVRLKVFGKVRREKMLYAREVRGGKHRDAAEVPKRDGAATGLHELGPGQRRAPVVSAKTPMDARPLRRYRSPVWTCFLMTLNAGFRFHQQRGPCADSPQICSNTLLTARLSLDRTPLIFILPISGLHIQ